MKWLLKVYDYFTHHHGLLWTVMGALVCVLLYLSLTLRYKEDISDFLPVDDEYKESMAIYQQISEASRIVIIFRGGDPDSLCAAIDSFEEKVIEDSLLDDNMLQTEVDIEAYIARLRYVHAHAPYFLKGDDYARFDSLLTNEGIAQAIAHDKEILSMPGTGLLQSTLASDPLGLFPLSAGASGQYAAASSAFTSYGGYMMTSDQTMAFAFYDSPYGSTESNHNAALSARLQSICDSLKLSFLSVKIDLLGAPVIAAGNAQRIKHDSLLAIALSIFLIAAILLYSFPRKRDILLIGAAITFGWLFGMSMLRLFAGEVSVIILGIGSVIIGIVVNYPLHLLVHQRYTTSVRQTLEEVLSPLVIGNITTIGAFLALTPLKATALRDLGIFASAMLLGTILFCVFVLPHIMTATPTVVREIHLPATRRTIPARHKMWATAICLVLLTSIFYIGSRLSNETLFDSNLSHINYMTPQQKADFAYFDQFQGTSDEPAYLASSAREELHSRLNHWNEFIQKHDINSICASIEAAALQQGFRANSFEPFCQMLRTDFSLSAQQETLHTELAQLWPGRFDTASLNSQVAEALSSNFDYLGLVCSAIVFLFLCLSFKSIWLALIAFLPMAISWIWIFGLMHLFGLHFNIVNIILATFIFGQGDDYTIFIVEGLVDEHKKGKPILPQFKQSILLSALIMLIGIGVLVFAKHPAMHGLGAVTLVGMACVVLLACTLPPLLFKLLIRFRKI